MPEKPTTYMSRLAQENFVEKPRCFREARRLRIVLVPTAASLLSVPAAFAADAASTEVEQVVVTAQKQAYRGDTPLQELPQSVQTITAEMLKDVGVTRLNDALDMVSGVARQNNFGGLWDAYAIRGFAGNENLPSGFLVNGFNAGRGFGGPRDLSDVDHIEVLKGPSSALFGRGEPGGTVNIITKKPQFKEQGSVALSGGKWQTYRAEADFTGPLTDSVAGRINGAYEHADSFRDTVTSKKYVVTPSFLARLGEKTSIAYEFEYVHAEAPFDRGVVARNGVLGIIPVSTFLGEPGNRPTVVNAYSNQVNLQHDFNSDWTLLVGFGALNTSLKGTAEDPELGATRNPFLQKGTFLPNNILSRRRISRNYHGNDLVPRAEVTGRFDTAGLVHHLLVGADYDDFKLNEVQGRYRPPVVSATSTLAQLNAIDVFNPVYGILPPLSPFTNTLERDYAWGTYLHDQIDLTEQWKFHAGVRYDNFRQRLQDDIAHAVSHQKVNATSPSFGLVYEPFTALTLYASYAKGFRPEYRAECRRGGIRTGDDQVIRGRRQVQNPGKHVQWHRRGLQNGQNQRIDGRSSKRRFFSVRRSSKKQGCRGRYDGPAASEHARRVFLCVRGCLCLEIIPRSQLLAPPRRRHATDQHSEKQRQCDAV